MFYQYVKFCFVLFLLVSFIFLMAWPSLTKFRAGGIVIEVSQIPEEKGGKLQIQELESPALTFCARNTSYWKNATVVVDDDMVNANCKMDTNEEVNDCIKEKTFNLDDTIKTAFHGATNPKLIKSQTHWRPNFGSPHLGMCHTFTYGTKLQADMVKDSLTFQLDPNLSYKVIIHDPKFFLMASNPLVFPRIWKEFKTEDIKPSLSGST